MDWVRDFQHDEADLYGIIIAKCFGGRVLSAPLSTTTKFVLIKWTGIHEYVTRYVASCDLCQRNVSKGTVAKAPMGKLPLIGTAFSVMCVWIS